MTSTQDILLTNGEVVEVVLQESTTVLDTRVQESLNRVVSSLAPVGEFQRDRVESLVQELKEKYQLTKEEVLQLVNHRPKTVLEAFLCVEQGILDGRIQEEDLQEGFDYYDVDSIMSEENIIPCVLQHGCTGVGRVLDPGADIDDLAPGTRVELPLWMVQVMAKRQLLQVDLPIYFKDHMRRKIRAGAGCENLRVRCNHFYTVAHKVHAAMVACGHGDESFPDFIAQTFAGRYRDLLTKAPTLDNHADASDIQAKLTNEELSLFNLAVYSAVSHDRYRANKSNTSWMSKRQHHSVKRPRGDA